MESESMKILETYVRKNWDCGNHPEQWRNLPEIPNKAEIMPKIDEDEDADPKKNNENWDDYQKDPIYHPDLPKNIIKGPWPSKEEYISAHYQILREDAIAPLRASIKYFKKHRNMDDDNDTCIYTHLHFKGLKLGPLGAAMKVSFSTERAGKQIRWQQSKRLFQGTMVALSPASDMFEKVCKIAIVAARPILDGLDQNPPMIELFWGDHADTVFDPIEPYVMIEARAGYFEAYRHVLAALQKLRTERFSLAKHIVALDPDIGAPGYLKEHSILNLSSLAPLDVDDLSLATSDEADLHNIDVLEHFPIPSTCGMDASQISALRSMITRKVSIIQGPPGTGKTFTSVSSIKVMLNNLRPDDPPLVIAAQTNHALDQLMNHLLTFEEKIVRLGGRCDKQNVDIIKHTLYELRMATKGVPNGAKGLKACKIELEQKVDEIQRLMAPLLAGSVLTDEILIRNRLITEAQKDSLYEAGWCETNQSQKDDKCNFTAISAWLGADGLTPIPRTPQVNLGLPLEEADLEFEQLQELEQELEGQDFEEDNGRLFGRWLPFQRDFTGKASATIDDRKIRKFLRSHESLYDIPGSWRGSIYRYWEKQLNKDCLAKLQILLADYNRIVDTNKITKWNCNIKLIRHLGTKLIGCTTTGLSKYRPLLAALQPRILLIEEAAETLESSVMSGMFDSLEHLILVGDHKQLKAHSNIQALEGAPFHMSVSMFERLVSNSIGFTMLNTQRRMISDIRKLLCISPEPFYPELHDHPSVEDRVDKRAPVPGMGGRDTYFFHHSWPETRGSDLSRHNQDEAEMVAGFFQHLVLNGIKHPQITVLTFYNGQRKTILKELKKHPGLRGNTYFNVFTVDSYQGEENDIILLSLVRSNDFLGIGFLESKNRLVVALSRARRGLYLFGNAITLTAAETSDIGIGRDVLWTPVITFMKAQGRFDLDGGLPITCSNHGTTLEIREADDWLGLAGGCDKDCVGILPCGHNCPLKCHHFEHSIVICRVACPKILACGHGCSHYCGEPCDCSHCEESHGSIDDGDYMAPITRNSDPVHCYDLMPGNQFAATSSCKATHINPSTTSLRSGPGMPDQWKNWDAKKSDAEMAEKARLLEAEKPRVDASKLVYNDTWRPATVENGMRVLSGPERKVVRRLENNDQSPTRGVMVPPTRKVDAAVAKASDDGDIADIIAQMSGFSFSKHHPVHSFTSPELASTNVSDLVGLELFSSPDHATHAPSSDNASPPTPVNTEKVQHDSSITLVDHVIFSPVDGSRRGVFEAKSPLKDTSPKAAAAEMIQNVNLIDLDEADPPPATLQILRS